MIFNFFIVLSKYLSLNLQLFLYLWTLFQWILFNNIRIYLSFCLLLKLIFLLTFILIIIFINLIHSYLYSCLQLMISTEIIFKLMKQKWNSCISLLLCCRFSGRYLNKFLTRCFLDR